MELKLKVYLTDKDGEKFMGIGVLWLLKEVEESGSLRKAASNLSISYSKAYYMIDKLEKSLSIKVIDRKKGGQNRDGASLTDKGREFIALYDTFQKEAKQRIEENFDSFKAQVAKIIGD